MSLLLGVLAVFTLGGGVLMLLLWQEQRDSGVLTNQIERTWDLFDDLRRIEEVVAFAVVPLATAWDFWPPSTSAGPPPAGAIPSSPPAIPLAVAGVWAIGAGIVEPADDWATATGGILLQALVLGVPVIVLDVSRWRPRDRADRCG